MKTRTILMWVITLAAVMIFAACGDKESGDLSTPDHTHQWGAWAVTTPATCTTAGVETRVCDLDATHVETRPIAAIEHTWNTETGLCTVCSSLMYSLGETGPGGGKIFYVFAGGFTMTDNSQVCHYLEAAPSDQSTGTPWGGHGTTITGITTFTSKTDPNAIMIGNGRKDTQLIVDYLRDNTGETGRAAQLCKSYTGGGCTDWFLPSCGELYQLYSSSVGNMTTDWYWSSSQYDGNYAWYQRFNLGYQGNLSKNVALYVRAIRAF